AVIYRVPSGASPIGGLTSGGRYYVLKQSDYAFRLTASYATVNSIKFHDNDKNPDSIERTDGKNWVDFGFAAGQTVTVSGAANAENTGTFTIASVSGATMTLTAAAALKNETIVPSDNRTVLLKGAVIALNPAKLTADDRNVTHSLTKTTDLPI